MSFERESFVPVCISLTFVCTSKSSEIQRGSVRDSYIAHLINFQDIEMEPMALERAKTEININK